MAHKQKALELSLRCSKSKGQGTLGGTLQSSDIQLSWRRQGSGLGNQTIHEQVNTLYNTKVRKMYINIYLKQYNAIHTCTCTHK